jgi:hypothetical protein
VDIARGEIAEAQLDAFIERRSRNGEVDPDEADPGYMESVRLYHERSEAEMRERWTEYHTHMAMLHGRLADEHAHKAEKLCEEGEK